MSELRTGNQHERVVFGPNVNTPQQQSYGNPAPTANKGV